MKKIIRWHGLTITIEDNGPSLTGVMVASNNLVRDVINNYTCITGWTLKQLQNKLRTSQLVKQRIHFILYMRQYGLYDKHIARILKIHHSTINHHLPKRKYDTTTNQTKSTK